MKKKKKYLVLVAVLAVILVLALFLVLSGCSDREAVRPKREKTVVSAEPEGEEAGGLFEAVRGADADDTTTEEEPADAAVTEQPENTTDPAKENAAAEERPPEVENKPVEPQTPAKPQQPTTPEQKPSTHEHIWNPVYSTVHHEEVGHYENVEVQAAWDEPQYEWCEVCNACGAKFHGSAVIDHISDVHDGAGTYSTKRFTVGSIHHDAVYEKEWVVDSAAWDESVITGYECVCGVKKGA